MTSRPWGWLGGAWLGAPPSWTMGERFLCCLRDGYVINGKCPQCKAEEASVSEVKFIRTERPMKHVRYQCNKCGAEDSNKLFLHEQVAPVIPCHHCKAGQGMAIPAMLDNDQGMFLLEDAAE